MQLIIPMFILAGGLGTRLNTILDDQLKALTPVDNILLVELLLEYRVDKEIKKFILL